ncbi:MAG: hypothetical protein AAFQ02_02480 [Bacteroidota bacterium]
MQKLLFFSLITIIFLSSCAEDSCESTFSYQVYEPVYKTRDELSADVKYAANRPLESPGKIYYYNRYILINERNEGVHVIDNSDIRNPQRIGFLEIEGNLDIALRGSYLYADTWHSILVIDISDLENPEVTEVITDVKGHLFEESPGRFIVDYVETTATEVIDCSDSNAGELWFIRGGQLWVDNLARFSSGPAVDPSLDIALGGAPQADAGAPEGVAGSMSRMALFGGHFYYVNEYEMHVFDVEDPSRPEQLNRVYMEWGVETIFPYQENLFVGANNGMHIYDNSDPSNPTYLSTFAHANACDPVVVQGDIAYVTLRDGTECENFINQLDVVDVSNLLEPQLIASFPMHNPHGLSVRDEILYLCEGDQGLKVFDITEVEEIGQNQIGGVKEYDAYDVISLSPELLLMIGEDGFYQFGTDQPARPDLLSSIRIGE